MTCVFTKKVLFSFVPRRPIDKLLYNKTIVTLGQQCCRQRLSIYFDQNKHSPL
jgi:hypothetical protein